MRSTVRAAAATALAATAIVSGSTVASASDFHSQYWSSQCDNGRACVSQEYNVWNMEYCGTNAINGRFSYGRAHGNSFTVYYRSGLSDHVAAWSGRQLDGDSVIEFAIVNC